MQNSRNPSLTIFSNGQLGNSEAIKANKEQPLYPTGIEPIQDKKAVNINQLRKLQAEVEADGGLLPNPEISYYISSSKVHRPGTNIKDALFPIGINPNTFFAKTVNNLKSRKYET